MKQVCTSTAGYVLAELRQTIVIARSQEVDFLKLGDRRRAKKARRVAADAEKLVRKVSK